MYICIYIYIYIHTYTYIYIYIYIYIYTLGLLDSAQVADAGDVSERGLPRAHTCTFQIDLPRYTSADQVLRRWSRTPRPQPLRFSKLVFLMNLINLRFV